MRYLFLILALFFSALLSVPAQEEFTVLSKFGENELKKDRSKKWELIKTGDKLYKNDLLKVGIDSFVSLLHNSGKCVTVDDEGVYSVNDIVGSVKDKKELIARKLYFSLANKIEENSEFFNVSKLKEKLELSGLVLRAIEGQPAINILYPANSHFVDSLVTFKWYQKNNVSEYKYEIKNLYDNQEFEKVTNVSEYKFVIKNLYDEQEFEKVTKDTSITVNFNEAGLEKGRYYFWYIANGEFKSEDHYIFRLGEDKSAAIRDTVSRLGIETTGQPDALRSLIMASYYESAGLNNKAQEYYLKSYEDSNGVEDYKRFYLLFLIRNGLISQAKSIVREK